MIGGGLVPAVWDELGEPVAVEQLIQEAGGDVAGRDLSAPNPNLMVSANGEVVSGWDPDYQSWIAYIGPQP